MIGRELAYFFAALRFFTRLPVPAWVGHSGEQLNHAARYFPLVGVIVGAIGAAITLGALQLWPAPLAVLLGMAATLLATGAFHEDGLADSIDGFGGGWSREDVLRIMKDSRIGSYGAIGIGLTLLAKFEVLTALATVSPAPTTRQPVLAYPFAQPDWLDAAGGTFCALLVCGHAASRFAATTLIFALDYARDDASSKSKPLATRMGKGELVVAGFFGLAPCLLLPPTQAVAALALTALVTLLAARHFVRRIGGYTGDCLGATQQLAELAFYLGMAAAL